MGAPFGKGAPKIGESRPRSITAEKHAAWIARKSPEELAIFRAYQARKQAERYAKNPKLANERTKQTRLRKAARDAVDATPSLLAAKAVLEQENPLMKMRATYKEEK